MDPNRKLNEEVADFLAKRGEYADDVDVWPTPKNPAKPLVGADLGIKQRGDFLREIGAFPKEAWASASLARHEEPLVVAPPTGVKNDGEKPMLSMLGMVTRALALVSRVQEYGARKYPSPDNWKRVKQGSRRYRDAALRHLFADIRGEATDPETGFAHLAHAACCILIALEHDLGFEAAVDGVELEPLAPTPAGETLPSWRFERPPRR